MSNLEDAETQAEALATADRRSTADRARFWAGLNRYLQAESEHEQKLADEERTEQEPGGEGPAD